MFSYRNNNLLPLLVGQRKNTNKSCILFTNARDEPNIEEWIAHHLLLGFDKIVVYDHLSKVSIEQTSRIKDKRVSIVRVHGAGNIKIGLMNNALTKALKDGHDWMLYLDADEFLNLNGFKSVKEYLNHFVKADSIGVNWLMFGTSGYTTQPSGLITEHFIRSDVRLNSHVKTFVRPGSAVKCVNPHYFVMSEPSRCYSGNGTRMNMGPFNNQPIPFVKAKAYIAHYYTQSEEEHLRRKNRLMDDGTTNKASGIKDVHKMHNGCANNQLKNKYSEGIRNFLGKCGSELVNSLNPELVNSLNPQA